MNLQATLMLVCSAVVFLDAVYIYWRYSGQRLHRFLALQIAGTAAYGVSVFGMDVAPSLEAATNWMRYGIVLQYALIFTFYWFAVVFSRTEGFRWTRWVIAILAVPAAFHVVGEAFGWLPAPLMEFRPGQGWFPYKDPVYLGIYLPCMNVLMVGALGLLIWRMRETKSSLEHQNLVIMFMAMAAAFFLAMFRVLPQTSVLFPLSPLSYTVIVTWGLTRRRLLNLDFLVKEGVIAAVGSVLLTASVAAVVGLGLLALKAQPGIPTLFLAALMFAVLYPWCYRWTRALLGRWLGRQISTSQRLLEYSLVAGAHPAFDDQMRACLERLVSDHGLSRAVMLLPDRTGRLVAYAAQPSEALPASSLQEGLDPGGVVARALLAAPRGLDVDTLGWTHRYELKPVHEGTVEAVRGFLEATRSQACFPLALRGRLRGLLLIGAPTSGRGLMADEMDFLGALTGQLAGMVENASLEGQVQQADRLSTLGVLAASLAHEIRNPLASISVFSQMLGARHDDPIFREKFSRVVQGELDKLTRLTEDLLNLARPATRAPRVVDFGQLCHREQQLISYQFKKRQVQLVVNAPDGVLVHGVESQLSQVFLNLLLNALEVSSSGQSVSVELFRRENEAELRTRDMGPGIRPDQMQRLFEPFFTTKEDGHGLGLATSRRIIESFGGSLEAANAPGGGAEFTVRLPIRQEVGSQAAA